MLLLQNVVQEELVEEENTLKMSQHCIGSHMSVGRPCVSEDGGRTGQLALLWDFILLWVFPPSERHFEHRAKNYSVLAHNHFIKQVSQTVGQRWLIAVAMEVQELMLPPGDPHFLSHQVLPGPDFLSSQDRKIKDVVIMVVLCSTFFLSHCHINDLMNILRIFLLPDSIIFQSSLLWFVFSSS